MRVILFHDAMIIYLEKRNRHQLPEGVSSRQEQERMQQQIYRLIAQHFSLSMEKIDEMFRRDRFMNAVEAKEYGMVDELLGDAQLL